MENTPEKLFKPSDFANPEPCEVDLLQPEIPVILSHPEPYYGEFVDDYLLEPYYSAKCLKEYEDKMNEFKQVDDLVPNPNKVHDKDDLGEGLVLFGQVPEDIHDSLLGDYGDWQAGVEITVSPEVGRDQVADAESIEVKSKVQTEKVSEDLESTGCEVIGKEPSVENVKGTGSEVAADGEGIQSEVAEDGEGTRSELAADGEGTRSEVTEYGEGTGSEVVSEHVEGTGSDVVAEHVEGTGSDVVAEHVEGTGSEVAQVLENGLASELEQDIDSLMIRVERIFEEKKMKGALKIELTDKYLDLILARKSVRGAVKFEEIKTLINQVRRMTADW